MPSHSLLSILGVLRRPATVADAPPDLRATLAAKDLIFGQIFARYIRRARVVAGVPYYVMPGRARACGTPSQGGYGASTWCCGSDRAATQQALQR